MSRRLLLEIVTFNLQSALDAAAAGADRVEICENYLEGGTTPSLGTVAMLKEQVRIPAFPMIRPRGGDFLYNNEEIKAMRHDLEAFKDLRCEGVVLGCLRSDGSVDVALLEELVRMASPMEVTFHRAFDRTPDQVKALEDIIKCGCKRILTSGGKPFADQGVENISELVKLAGERISLVAGGGVNSGNIEKLLQTGVTEFHAPARFMNRGAMEYINSEMKETLEFVAIDRAEVAALRQKLGLGSSSS